MKKIVVVMLLSIGVLFANDTFYGIKMLSKVNKQEFKVREKDKDYPLRWIYDKQLKNEFFTSMSVMTDKNGIIYKIVLMKNNVTEFDIYNKGNEILNKLQSKYGKFHCSSNAMPLIGKTDEICIKNMDTNKIELSLWLFGKQSLSVSYINQEITKIMPETVKEKSLNKL